LQRFAMLLSVVGRAVHLLGVLPMANMIELDVNQPAVPALPLSHPARTRGGYKTTDIKNRRQ